MGDLDLPNRIVMAPLTRMRAHPLDHVPTPLQAEYYAQRASAGLIIAEATAISPEGFGWADTMDGGAGTRMATRIGWHTFRHTYSSLLAAMGNDVKVVQELMRHAKISTTMEVLHPRRMDKKRIAQSKRSMCSSIAHQQLTVQ